MSRRKSNKPEPTVVVFTRAEFMLFESLLDHEIDTPLAELNDHYRSTLQELKGRVATIGSNTEWGHVTDSVKATV